MLDIHRRQCFGQYGYGTGNFASRHDPERIDYCSGCLAKKQCARFSQLSDTTGASQREIYLRNFRRGTVECLAQTM